MAGNDDFTAVEELTLNELLDEIASIPDGESCDSLVGKRIKWLRESRPSANQPNGRMSHRELAAPGVSYPFISRIEAGDRRPSAEALKMLALKLGTYPRYLAHGGTYDRIEAENWVYRAFQHLPMLEHRRLMRLYAEIRKRNAAAGAEERLPRELAYPQK
jgi:transcriptional regulator with XRE-family HTH domain